MPEPSGRRAARRPKPKRSAPSSAKALPGKVRNGFPSGIASKQRDRAVCRFSETVNRSDARERKA
ncbi:hypothetical protein EH240_16960 [Mesorhizobium tamadayense]|uniref:Uncharacterized protein n=1 Tax=Mesorhizobium tamadayense TaxID=425306 RepID=A0A3P3FQ59_9HYPH|nr:hypothetical protein EH240_16960 [Mesorhizobium tamadayense]